MNTTQLECFVQVASNLNFRRAAEELHLSQPTVSKQVSTLEGEVGGALFTRSTRSVALTALGASFLPDAEEILRLMYASSERARKVASGETLVIGYSDSCELGRLEAVLRQLRKRERELGLSLRQAPRDVNVEQLSRGRVDVVMGFEDEALAKGGIVFEPLREDALVLVARKGTRLSRLESASADDVAGMPQVVCLPAGLRRRGYAAQDTIPETPPELTTHCQTTPEALCLVDAGLGYALLPSVEVGRAPQHAYVSWEGSPKASYGAYVLVGERDGPVDAFLEVARELYCRE